MRRKRLTTIGSVAILIALWQLVAISVDQPELLPTVPRLLSTIGESIASISFYRAILSTMSRILICLAISLFASFVMAILFSRFKLIYELFRPTLAIMRSIPVISFILLALIFLNNENIPLMIGFLTMFPLLTENLTKGMQSLNPSLTMMAKMFNIGRRNRLMLVIYPQIAPFLYSGLTSAAGFGWRAIIMGEVLAQCSFGIGSEMKMAQNLIDVPTLLAWTIVAILMSYIFDKGIGRLSAVRCDVSFLKRDCYGHISKHITNITANNIGYHYGVEQFSHQFQHGMVYGLSGPSGRGKTTLLNMIGGILNPIHGSVEPTINDGISFVFQEPDLLPWLSAKENVALPLSSIMKHESAMSRAMIYLRMMGIEDLAERLPKEMSYGQQQRVAIARALSFPSPILLMDEPFKGLDIAIRQHIINSIKDIQQNEKRVIIFTSHSPEELSSLADEVIYL